jgi:hypothetical protein
VSPHNRGSRLDAPVVWCDPKTRVVIRGNHAVALSINEFVVYRLLRGRKNQGQGGHAGNPRGVARSRDLLDGLYAGVGDPPLWAKTYLRGLVGRLNRKLAHLGVRVRGVNRGAQSTYYMEERDRA